METTFDIFWSDLSFEKQEEIENQLRTEVEDELKTEAAAVNRPGFEGQSWQSIVKSIYGFDKEYDLEDFIDNEIDNRINTNFKGSCAV